MSTAPINRNLQVANKKQLFDVLAQMLFDSHQVSRTKAFLTDIEARKTLSVTTWTGIDYDDKDSV
ncbi:PTS sugar transporter subunit IIA [Vibrio fluvialis]|nr:PTS sugar transporter subunit IIA [Vibrio fluvialis]